MYNPDKPTSLDNQDIRNRGDRNDSSKGEDGRKINRRKFIKGLGIGAGAVFLAANFPWENKGELEKITDEPERYKIDFEERENEEEQTEETIEEDIEQGNEEMLSTKELLDFKKKGDVVLTPKTLESVKNYWKKVHSTKGNKLYSSLEKGYNNIGEYEEELEKIFIKEGVPKKFLYLAIAESYWKLDALSPVKASGPYQFMKATAKKYDLYSDNEKYDHRTDPFESARAAAELLKDLHNVSDDWDLALSGYNGGFIWKYLKENRGSGNNPSYENFLKYLEKKINYVRNEAKHAKYHENYKLISTLGSLAKWTGLKVSDIVTANGIKDPNKVRKGSRIKIPLLNDNAREWSYNKKIAGFSENLNYPAKFNGIYEAIEDGAVTKQKEVGDFSDHVTMNTHPNKKRKEKKQEIEKSFDYIVKQGEGWYRIHQNVKKLTNANEKEIMDNNIKIVIKGLNAGDIIKIPKKV